MALPVQSRFALLKIEDDSDNEAQKPVNDSKNKPQSASKKNKKKKKKSDQAENTDLRQLAFCAKGSKHPPPQQNQNKNSNPNLNVGPSKNNVTDKQWEQWKKADTEATSEVYETDLQHALLLSKIEFEKQKELDSMAGLRCDLPGSGKEGKKKKNKNKAQTMSIEQFNLSQQNGAQQHDEISAGGDARVPTEADSKFFEGVQDDASRIIKTEKLKEELKQQYTSENLKIAYLEKNLSKKDKEIAMLRATVKNLEDELQQVKKRNKQLCHILGQGEMKEKAEIQLRADDLEQVKNELTEKVTQLNSDLEKERSKVHSLKKDLEKFVKAGKHK